MLRGVYLDICGVYLDICGMMRTLIYSGMDGDDNIIDPMNLNCENVIKS